MAKLTHKNLFSLVDELVSNRLQFQGSDRFSEQTTNRNSVQPFALSAGVTRDISAQDLIRAVQQILNEGLPNRVISGLIVTAQDPITDKVNISAGKGTTGGSIYTLDSDVTIPIPFSVNISTFFVNLYNNTIMLDTDEDPKKLTIAKIVCPLPGQTQLVRDTDNDTSDAYIVNFTEYKLFGNADGRFEEDTLDLLRDNLDTVLADTLVGQLKISENLTVTNSLGSLFMDSSEIRIQATNGNVLSRFNQKGVFFYDNRNIELAKFTPEGSRIGNILVLPNSIQSGNFIAGVLGFQIRDGGDAEFNQLTVRGTIHATAGSIGGFTILSDKLYGGTIQTDASVGVGDTGVIMDSTGLRGFDAVLGQTFNLPTDGSRPSFASGDITLTNFEIDTSAVLRTSETVGDGTASSAGILINNTGLYGTEANQTLGNANLKALATGVISLTGSIVATAGDIGGVTITSDKLTGGTIEGSTVRGGTIETSSATPRIRIDETGLYYQATTSVGKYGASGSGLSGFQYGDGTKYGSGVSAYLFNVNFPILSVLAEQTLADIRLFNRDSEPSGAAEIGDLAVISKVLRICKTAGTPGTYEHVLTSDAGTGGTASAGAGNQYVEVNVNGTVYKCLHDGTI